MSIFRYPATMKNLGNGLAQYTFDHNVSVQVWAHNVDDSTVTIKGLSTHEVDKLVELVQKWRG